MTPKRVHIFFNDLFPEDVATRKLALLTSHSWEVHGWEPVFYNTLKTDGFQPFKRLTEKTNCGTRSMLSYANAWFERMKLAPGWFSSIDILNCGFTPGLAGLCEFEGAGVGCCNVQEVCFTAECLWVTPEFCRRAIEIINEYEAGLLPAVETEIIADEVILRKYAKYHTVPYMSFAMAQTGWQKYPLVHATESALKWFNPTK